MMAKSESAIKTGLESNSNKADFYKLKSETIQFYMKYILPEVNYLEEIIVQN